MPDLLIRDPILRWIALIGFFASIAALTFFLTRRRRRRVWRALKTAAQRLGLQLSPERELHGSIEGFEVSLAVSVPPYFGDDGSDDDGVLYRVKLKRVIPLGFRITSESWPRFLKWLELRGGPDAVLSTLDPDLVHERYEMMFMTRERRRGITEFLERYPTLCLERRSIEHVDLVNDRADRLVTIVEDLVKLAGILDHELPATEHLMPRRAHRNRPWAAE